MNPGRVANKVALVTGAGSGIGRATAVLLAREGATVVVTDIDSTTATLVANEITSAGGNALAAKLDVADESAWKEIMAKTQASHQKLDALVNNAGISISRPVAELSFADWRKVLSVNLDGVFLGTKHAIDAMKHGGSIVNVASVSGITPGGGAAAYCTSKAAVRMFSKSVAIECADAQTDIRVNCVAPGGVKTPMWEKEEFFRKLVDQHGGMDEAFSMISGESPSHQFFSPEEVAQTIMFLVSDESSHLTGTEIVLDRGHTG